MWWHARVSRGWETGYEVVSEHGASSRGNIIQRPLQVVGRQYFTDVGELGLQGNNFFLIEVLTQYSLCE